MKKLNEQYAWFLFGSSSETSLDQAALYLDKKFETYYFDFSSKTFDNDFKIAIQSTSDKEKIIWASHHIGINKDLYHFLYPEAKVHFTILELQKIIKPRITIFSPHDLSGEILPIDEKYLHCVDLICCPTEYVTKKLKNETLLNSSWIGFYKYSNENVNLESFNLKNGVLFTSDEHLLLEYLNSKKNIKILNKSFQYFKDLKIPIKIAPWINKNKLLEFFNEQGFVVLPPELHLVDLHKQTDLIFVAGFSSIIRESISLGYSPIIVEAPWSPSSIENYDNKLQYFQLDSNYKRRTKKIECDFNWSAFLDKIDSLLKISNFTS